MTDQKIDARFEIQMRQASLAAIDSRIKYLLGAIEEQVERRRGIENEITRLGGIPDPMPSFEPEQKEGERSGKDVEHKKE